jgi:hypothetical protein
MDPEICQGRRLARNYQRHKAEDHPTECRASQVSDRDDLTCWARRPPTISRSSGTIRGGARLYESAPCRGFYTRNGSLSESRAQKTKKAGTFRLRPDECLDLSVTPRHASIASFVKSRSAVYSTSVPEMLGARPGVPWSKAARGLFVFMVRSYARRYSSPILSLGSKYS